MLTHNAAAELVVDCILWMVTWDGEMAEACWALWKGREVGRLSVSEATRRSPRKVIKQRQEVA